MLLTGKQLYIEDIAKSLVNVYFEGEADQSEINGGRKKFQKPGVERIIILIRKRGQGK